MKSARRGRRQDTSRRCCKSAAPLNLPRTSKSTPTRTIPRFTRKRPGTRRDGGPRRRNGSTGSRSGQQVLDWDPPHHQWFVGGKLNVSYNCLDRHLAENESRVAYHWVGEPGDGRAVTYRDLYEDTCRLANVLTELGIRKGDRVAIYLPMIPELPVAMLACARIGAPHSVVFGGFSAESLRDRIIDAQAKVLITADGGYRRGQIVPLKEARTRRWSSATR